MARAAPTPWATVGDRREDRRVALTTVDLNRALLARQLLLERVPLSVTEAVRRVVALQAQEPASPYLALWARLSAFDPAELDAAFRDATVVKATLMRITLHAVLPDDHAPLHAAMVGSLRASRLFDRRFRESGVPIADVDAVLPDLLGFVAEPRSAAEVQSFLAERGLPHPRVWWALRTFAPVRHVPGGGAWAFGRDRGFAAMPPTWPADRSDEAVVHLARRYLAGFGPATALDLTQFSLLGRPVSRQALAALEDELVHLEGPDGEDLVDLADAPRPPGDVRAPARLLPMWDQVLLSHADRARIVPPEHRSTVLRRNGDCLPTVLVDGRVAGVWRATDDGIEVAAFEALDDDAWAELEVEARSLATLLADREPEVYRRYRHWWDALDAVHVRVLGH